MQRHAFDASIRTPEQRGRLDKRQGHTMMNLKDNAAAPSRTTVRIPTASGDELEAWLYLPEGDGPHPAVVMAHGIGAIKAGGLAPFAERFCGEGFAAVVFDYRQWGGSAGQPREELSFPRQREDYGTVIGWAAAHPDIDAHRVFAWGTSFAGMYIVELAVSDSVSPVRSARPRSLTGSPQRGWPRPYAGSSFWRWRC
jgi:dienelactone hydrolase